MKLEITSEKIYQMIWLIKKIDIHTGIFFKRLIDLFLQMKHSGASDTFESKE